MNETIDHARVIKERMMSNNVSFFCTTSDKLMLAENKETKNIYLRFDDDPSPLDGTESIKNVLVYLRYWQRREVITEAFNNLVNNILTTIEGEKV